MNISKTVVDTVKVTIND